MASNEQAFRSQLSQFRWARGNNNDSALPTAAAASANGGFFSRTYNTISNTASGYVPLRSNERSNEEEAMFALSRWERYVCHLRHQKVLSLIDCLSLVGFVMCLLGAAACFAIAFFIHLPLFALRPAKFATSITYVPIYNSSSTFKSSLTLSHRLGSILVMLGYVIRAFP
jgi:hypothetical protein